MGSQMRVDRWLTILGNLRKMYMDSNSTRKMPKSCKAQNDKPATNQVIHYSDMASLQIGFRPHGSSASFGLLDAFIGILRCSFQGCLSCLYVALFATYLLASLSWLVSFAVATPV